MITGREIIVDCQFCGEIKTRIYKCGTYPIYCSDKCKVDANIARKRLRRRRTCAKCEKSKLLANFKPSSDLCKECEFSSYYRIIYTKSCNRCEHEPNCMWLMERELAPLCFYNEDIRDLHTYERLNIADRIKASGIMGLRYYERFKEVQLEMI